jgi:serine/threonine protein kinase
VAGDPSSPAVGETIEIYRLVELLSRDHASHFSAIDTRSNLVVRLTVSSGKFSPAEAKRLVASAQIATTLRHPNLARVFEVGETKGRLWIASELIHAPTLEQVLLERGSLPMRLAASVARQIASGLAAAHARELLHLGLRTANVFLAGEQAKVGELAVFMLVGAGRTFTSPVYMAPEQVSGTGTRPDARTDVYAVGALLFQLLAGQPPFDGKTLQDLIQGILTKSPPRLQALKPRAAPLEAIVSCALQKNPAARFQTASELAAALEQIIAAPASEVDEDPVYRIQLRTVESVPDPGPKSIPASEPPVSPRVQNTWVVAPPAPTLSEEPSGAAARPSAATEASRTSAGSVLQFPARGREDSRINAEPATRARPAPAALAAPASTPATFRSDSSATTLAVEGKRPRVTREVGPNMPITQTETPASPLAMPVVRRWWRWVLLAVVIALAIATLLFAYSAYFAELVPTQGTLLASVKSVGPRVGGGNGGRR